MRIDRDTDKQRVTSSDVATQTEHDTHEMNDENGVNNDKDSEDDCKVLEEYEREQHIIERMGNRVHKYINRIKRQYRIIENTSLMVNEVREVTEPWKPIEKRMRSSIITIAKIKTGHLDSYVDRTTRILHHRQERLAREQKWADEREYEYTLESARKRARRMREFHEAEQADDEREFAVMQHTMAMQPHVIKYQNDENSPYNPDFIDRYTAHKSDQNDAFGMAWTPHSPWDGRWHDALTLAGHSHLNRLRTSNSTQCEHGFWKTAREHWCEKCYPLNIPWLKTDDPSNIARAETRKAADEKYSCTDHNNKQYEYI